MSKWNVTKGTYGSNYPAGMGKWEFGDTNVELETESFISLTDKLSFDVSFIIAARLEYCEEAWGESSDIDDVEFFITSLSADGEVVYANTCKDKGIDGAFRESKLGKAVLDVLQDQLEDGDFNDRLWEKANED